MPAAHAFLRLQLFPLRLSTITLFSCIRLPRPRSCACHDVLHPVSVHIYSRQLCYRCSRCASHLPCVMYQAWRCYANPAACLRQGHPTSPQLIHELAIDNDLLHQLLQSQSPLHSSKNTSSSTLYEVQSFAQGKCRIPSHRHQADTEECRRPTTIIQHCALRAHTSR